MPRRGESLTRILTLAKLKRLQALKLRREATVGSENDIVVTEVAETLLLCLPMVHKY
jgi:flagellar biogenesis protein FliO